MLFICPICKKIKNESQPRLVTPYCYEHQPTVKMIPKGDD
jgi:hypothetical protein